MGEVLHEDIPDRDIELIPMIEWAKRMSENPWLREHYHKKDNCERDSDCTVWCDDLICKTLYDNDRLTGIVTRKNECVRDKRYGERRAARQEAARQEEEKRRMEADLQIINQQIAELEAAEQEAARQEAARQVPPTGGRCTNAFGRMLGCFNSRGSGSGQGGGMKRRKINYHKKKSKRKISQKKTKTRRKKGKQTRRKKRR